LHPGAVDEPHARQPRAGILQHHHEHVAAHERGAQRARLHGAESLELEVVAERGRAFPEMKAVFEAAGFGDFKAIRIDRGYPHSHVLYVGKR
jgi:hypothetical protein